MYLTYGMPIREKQTEVLQDLLHCNHFNKTCFIPKHMHSNNLIGAVFKCWWSAKFNSSFENCLIMIKENLCETSKLDEAIENFLIFFYEFIMPHRSEAIIYTQAHLQHIIITFKRNTWSQKNLTREIILNGAKHKMVESNG